jgi:hypothetical protein
MNPGLDILARECRGCRMSPRRDEAQKAMLKAMWPRAKFGKQ